MKIFVMFSMMAGVILAVVFLTGNYAYSQVATTSQGNIYPNAVVIAPAAVVAQPNQFNNINNNNNNIFKPFFPNFFNPFFNPFFPPFFNNNFFGFSGVSSSPLLIP